jgi:aspartate aminotransferase
MANVSKRLNSLSESQTIAMNQKSNAMKAQGIDIINLSVGEPDFYTPDHIKQAGKDAIDANFSFYSPITGYPDLRKAICKKLKDDNHLDYTPEQIIVSVGAKHSIANVVLSVVDPGDEVIVPAPYWVSYIEQVKLAEGVNVIIEAGIDQRFKITPAQLEAAITSKTKAIILCSPSNPTGAIYTREELAGLVKVLEKHPNIVIISDEIYEHINFVGVHTSIAEFPSIKERVAVVNGVSKSYAMTGWRIGYMGAPLWLAKACDKLQGQMTSGASSISQKAAVIALAADQKCTKDMNLAFRRRRDYVLSRIAKMKGVRCDSPDGAFYVFPDMSAFYGKSYDGKMIAGSADMSLYLLEKGQIATVPGDAFGADDYIRISFATSDENLVKAMDRMEAALKSLD